MKMKLLHLWFGCEKFNRRWPHWKKTYATADSSDDSDLYPRCSICGDPCCWMFGYKRWAPDENAQRIQGRGTNPPEAYWAKHDGWPIPASVPLDEQKKINEHIRGEAWE